jgi:long-chain acyl-CoA synthetase
MTTFQNITSLLQDRVDAAPDKVFLFSQPDRRQFTYSQFADAVARTSALLAGEGVAKGDVVSLLMPNSVEYVIAYFACWRLGALAGPINSHLKEQEISYVVSNSEAKALLVGSEFLPVINQLRDLPTLNAVILFDDEAQATRDFTKVEATADVTLDDEAIIIYTSGTTGKPKGCLLTHGNVVANARQISQWLGFNESDRLLTMMPLFHMNAVSVTTMSALYAGGSSVVSPKFSCVPFLADCF